MPPPRGGFFAARVRVAPMGPRASPGLRVRACRPGGAARLGGGCVEVVAVAGAGTGTRLRGRAEGAPARPSDPAEEVYLDHAATTPVRPEAAAAWARAASDLWANPSSVHAAGRRVRAALERARGQVAALLGGNPHHWVFTSGGTEANNLAVLGAGRAGLARGRRRIVVGAAEHHSVLDAAEALGREGAEVVRVAPDAEGRVDAARVAEALGPDTALCTLMLGNNEVGALQPAGAVAAVCRALGVPFHTDAVAVAGKVAVRVEELGADLVAVSAHKIYGPKGVGALYVRPGLEILPLLHGGGQERRWRPGTENVPGIVAFGVAAELAAEEMGPEAGRLRGLAAELTRAVLAADVGAVPTGPRDPAQRIPGLASFVFPGFDGEALLVSLDLQGIRASSGSACTSGSVEPSHVLRAMGLPPDAAAAALRLSLGRGSTGADAEALVAALRVAARRQRAPGGKRL